MTTDDRPPPDLDAADVDPLGTPRWVKVFGTILIVVIVFFVLLMLTAGPGRHGPRRHLGDATSPPVSAVRATPAGSPGATARRCRAASRPAHANRA